MTADVSVMSAELGQILVPRTGSVQPASPGLIDELIKKGEFFWLDVGDDEGGQLEQLSGLLDFDDDAIHMLRRYRERATLTDLGDFVAFGLYGVGPRARFVEVHGLACPRFVLTVHREPCPFLASLTSPDGIRPEPSCQWVTLLHRITDVIVGSFRAVLDEIDQEIDDAEDELFAEPDQELLERLFHLKREIISMRQVVVPQRDLYSRLAAGVVRVPELAGEGLYFRITFDYLLRTSDLLDSYRDLLSGALDAYLSTISNRTATVTKQLAVIATIFLPLSFITGFFGQNFGFLEGHIQGRVSFFVLGLGTEAVAVILLLLLFKRRGWLRADQ